MFALYAGKFTKRLGRSFSTIFTMTGRKVVLIIAPFPSTSVLLL